MDTPSPSDQLGIHEGPKFTPPASPSSCARAQLTRLLQLVLALQSDRYPNARELAELCAVSRRTIYRDLEILADAGVLICYRSERQGYQLTKSFFLHPPNLDENEALGLLVLTQQWRGNDGFGLIRQARAGAEKLVQVLPHDIRGRVLARAEAFYDEEVPAELPADRQLLYESIVRAIAQKLQLRVWYHGPEGLEPVVTKLSPYRIFLAGRTWCVVGRSTLHREVRILRVARIQRVVLTEDSFTIPGRFSLRRFLGQAWSIDRGQVRHSVWLRFTARSATEVRDTTWQRGQRLEALDDGRVDLHLEVDGLDEVLSWSLGFGDQVEILAPADLRQRAHEVATRIARLHAPDRDEARSNGPPVGG